MLIRLMPKQLHEVDVMTRFGGLRLSRLASCLAALFSMAPALLTAQSLDGTGVVPTGLLLRQMDGVKRVLMIGAHPDDEDTSFLTAVARGMGAETAYLSLTRGDGGQNLIGSELWEGLGAIRTGELGAARALDGGRQFFTRAFDFGYSKSADEALALWQREALLEDVVWVVRTFRPHVIVSVWSGTPRDGHGQHQASGIMAREAFAAAGDPARFPQQLELGLEAWTPSKLLQSSFSRFGRGPGPDESAEKIEVQVGAFDPLMGRSYLQLAMESRSQHRSQDMGAPRPLGPRSSTTIVIESRVEGDALELFAGIDTTLVGITAGLPSSVVASVRPHLEAYRALVASARDGFGLDPSLIADDLAGALAHLQMADAAAGTAADTEFRMALDHKLEIATEALMSASGVIVDVRSDDDMVVPGQKVSVRVQLWNGGHDPLGRVQTSLVAPSDWDITLERTTGLTEGGGIAPGGLGTFEYIVALSSDADVSELYFLREDRDGPRYRWPDDESLWGLPRDPTAVHARVSYATGNGGSVTAESLTGWRYVGVDQARGEFEKPVLIVPALSATVSPGGMVWPQADRAARTVSVTVRSESPEAQAGQVRLSAPAGWSVSPTSQPFELDGQGVERAVVFEVAPNGSPAPGNHSFEASLQTSTGVIYDQEVSIIDYEHIERSMIITDAAIEVTVIPVRVAEGLRVGYIMGTGDDGPNAIRSLGARVTLVDEARIRDGDFSDFDVVVLGVRAYEARPEVRAVNERLLDFARAGGTVINQYNQYQFSNGEYAPHGLTIGRPAPRVADETATITILEPDAPIFTTPNRITQSDFEGWVQERGLYFASEWADEYVPMLELHDPGEDPRLGSLLVAPVGDGVYAYVALSLFRQWAGRVPGAYRLFANLISLGADDWADFAAGR